MAIGATAAAAAAGACSPGGLLTRFDRISRGGVARRATGLSYGADPRQRLDIWAPAGPSPAGGWPTIIFFYGGGWASGNRGDYGFAAAGLASRGFVVAVPDYRLVPEVRFPTFIEDCALAVRWVGDHSADYGGDRRRLALCGHSAGAYNAAMIALDRHYLRDAGADPRSVRAAALLAGPYDFYPFTEDYGRNALGNWPVPAETQPITFARGDAPPMLLLHGSDDRTAYPRNSINLAKRLRDLGAPVTLKLYPGKGHVDLVASLSRTLRGRTPALDDVASFLHQNLD